MTKCISIVIPVFNEEANIPAIINTIEVVFSSLEYDYEIIFINDGSSDGSLKIIQQFAKEHSNLFYISFSRNFGKDNAMMAGFKYAQKDAVITMDADLQHPPALIKEFIQYWEDGFDVVYAYREDKNHHASLVQKLSSFIFYKIINRLSDIKLEDGISDYRLIDKKIRNILINLHEDRPFYRGLIKWVGFQQKGIPYTPEARLNGKTKYNTKNLLRLALQGITSFSIKPMGIAIYLGFTFSLLSLLYIPYVLLSLYYGKAISGWASLIVTIVFFGGLQLMILGILGIYIGKLFMQNKQRPHFIINESNIA